MLRHYKHISRIELKRFFYACQFHKGNEGNRAMIGFKRSAMSVLLISGMAIGSTAQADFIYSYTGNSFTYAGNSVPSSLAYSTKNLISFTFITAQQVVGVGAVNPVASSWVFSDGTQTISSLDALKPASFQLTVTPSNSQVKVFDYWTIALNTNIPFTNFPNYLNTTYDLNQYSQYLVYDWGQNQLGNYGGNNGLPGTWTVRPSDIAAVPLPSVLWLFSSSLIGLVFFTRGKNKSANLIAA